MNFWKMSNFKDSDCVECKNRSMADVLKDSVALRFMSFVCLFVFLKLQPIVVVFSTAQ
jgi:hypothetical protein